MAMVNKYSAVAVILMNKVLHFTQWIGIKPIRQNVSPINIFNRHVPVMHDTFPSFNKPVITIIQSKTASKGD